MRLSVMVGGREGVAGGRKLACECEMSAERRRCLAVAARAGRGGRGCRAERMGCRNVGESVGRPREMRAAVSWGRVGAAIGSG